MEPPLSPKESPIQLKIDEKISTKAFSQFNAIVFSIAAVIFFVAANIPSSYIFRKRAPADTLQSVYNTLQYDQKPFSFPENAVYNIQIDELRALNRFVALEMTPLDVKNHEGTLKVQVEVSAFSMKGAEIDTSISREQKEIIFDCSNSQEYPVESKQLLQIPTEDAKSYYFVVKILNSQEIVPLVSHFSIESVTLNINYRIYLFIVKLILLVVTICCVLWHFSKMKDLTKEFYTREQKMFFFIAPALITINEPFTIYILEGKFYTWSTIVNFLVFSTVLVRYWLSSTHELAGSDSSLIEKSSKFVNIYTLVYFIVLLTTYITLGNDCLQEPTFDFFSTENGFFEFLKIVLYLTQIIALAWIAIKTWRILQRLNEITEREQTYFMFSAFFILYHFYLVAKGGLFIFSFDGSRVIQFCGIFTLYVFATTYLYLPTKQGLANAQHIKKYDNPAVKDRYKDLEASDEHPPQYSNKNTEDHFEQSAPSSEKIETKYPYENKEEEDL